VIIPEDRFVILAVDRLPPSFWASVQFIAAKDADRTPSLYVIRKADFEAEARLFIESTIERARSTTEFAYWADWLGERWREAQTDEENPRNRLSWMVGGVSATRVQELQQDQPKLANGLRQLLLDCPVVASRNELNPVEEMLRHLWSSSQSSPRANTAPRWETLNTGPIATSQPDFSQGYQLARLVRDRMGLGKAPIRHLSRVLNDLDVVSVDSIDTSLFRVAVCAEQGRRAQIVSSATDERMQEYASSRFATTSALGRLLWQARVRGDGLVCGAQGTHAMLSQSRRANAFAAEFLLPAKVAEGALSRDQVYDLAEEYGISASAALWHAHNIRQTSHWRDERD
jgi:hypothetical protein